MPERVLELQQIGVTRDRPLLKDINWRVHRGEHWAVVGENGAGKSTLLQVIGGYLWPSRGRVTVMGQIYGQVDIREVRKSLGWVSDGLGEWVATHHGGDTVTDLVEAGSEAIIGRSRLEMAAGVRERSRRVLAEFGLEDFRERRYATLSQGERKRTLLARAFMAQPDLILLDEPCAGLDLKAREQFLHVLDRLMESSEGPTIILVTHHVEELGRHLSHVMLLRDGVIINQGPKEAVLTEDSLSALYDVPVRLTWEDGRAWAHIASFR